MSLKLRNPLAMVLMMTFAWLAAPGQRLLADEHVTRLELKHWHPERVVPLPPEEVFVRQQLGDTDEGGSSADGAQAVDDIPARDSSRRPVGGPQPLERKIVLPTRDRLARPRSLAAGGTPWLDGRCFEEGHRIWFANKRAVWAAVAFQSGGAAHIRERHARAPLSITSDVPPSFLIRCGGVPDAQAEPGPSSATGAHHRCLGDRPLLCLRVLQGASLAHRCLRGGSRSPLCSPRGTSVSPRRLDECRRLKARQRSARV